jgi:clan AA aspartic protease (TIGR02281 family)
MQAAILLALLLGFGTAQAESVPLIYEIGTYLVPVFINEEVSLNFTIDSGASDVSIPADVFSTLVRTGTILKSDFVDTQEYELADGTTRSSNRFRIRSLRVGNVEVHNVVASVAPPEGSLLLGQSFLSRMKTWSIDNERRLLLFNQPPTHSEVGDVHAPTPVTQVQTSATNTQPPAAVLRPATPLQTAAADDTLLKAVAIALTGNDASSVSVCPNCVFQIATDSPREVLTFHVNSIDPMLLKVSGDLDGTILNIAGEEVVVDEYDDDPAKKVEAMHVLLTHHNQWTVKPPHCFRKNVTRWASCLR